MDTRPDPLPDPVTTGCAAAGPGARALAAVDSSLPRPQSRSTLRSPPLATIGIPHAPGVDPPPAEIAQAPHVIRQAQAPVFQFL